MSSLNLLPDPKVIAVQAAVFFLSMLVIKKLFLEPYLRLMGYRDSKTVGSNELAKDLISRTEQLASKLGQDFANASKKITTDTDNIRDNANSEKARLLTQLTNENKKRLSDNEARIKSELAKERSHVSVFSDTLAEELYQKALQ